MSIYSTSDEIKASLTQAYDAIAPQYLVWGSRFTPDRMRHLSLILPYITSQTTPRILELGCGAGEPVTFHLASIPNVRIVANDISRAQIDMARKTLPPEIVDLAEGDMNSLVFEDESFHAVVALYSVIHLPRHEQVQIIEKIARWLKTGGHALVNLANGAVDGHWERDWLQKGANMFWSSWSPEEYARIFKDAGLTVQSTVKAGKDEQDRDEQFLWVVAMKPEGSK